MISTSTKRGGAVLNFLSTGNFALSIIMGGSMQQLWGMIRAMQMIVLGALVRVPTPAHTFLFFTGCMIFAQMDVLDGQGLYEILFEFKDTKPLSQNFELFGLGDKNFMLNTGSYFVIFVGVLLFAILKKITNSCMKMCARSERARKIGIKVYEPSYY